MFVVFRQVGPPNSLDEAEASQLVQALRQRPLAEQALDLVTLRSAAEESAARKIDETIKLQYGLESEVAP